MADLCLLEETFVTSFTCLTAFLPPRMHMKVNIKSDKFCCSHGSFEIKEAENSLYDHCFPDMLKYTGVFRTLSFIYTSVFKTLSFIEDGLLSILDILLGSECASDVSKDF